MNWLIPLWICFLLIFTALAVFFFAAFYYQRNAWLLFGAGVNVGCAMKTCYTLGTMLVEEI